MSKREAVLLASRALAVLLMVWALSDVSYLPGRVFSLLHYLNREPSSAYTEYMRHYYITEVGFLVTRIVGFSLLSRVLFKGGPDIHELLLPASDQQARQD
jgi:hypothetical protein